MSNGIVPLLLLLASPSSPETPPLPAPGARLSAELPCAELHRYRIALNRGEFLHVSIAQKGVDVAVALRDPAGNAILDVNETEELERDEPVYAVAQTDGEHVLEIRTAPRCARSGAYVLQVLERRPATPRDRARARAEADFAAAVGVRDQGTADALRKARESFEALVPAWRDLGDRTREAEMLCLSGDVSLRLGEAPRALQVLQSALPLVDGQGHPKLEAEILNNIAGGYNNTGDQGRSLEYYDRAAALARGSGDRRGLMLTLANEAVVRDELGEKPKALELLREALALARELSVPRIQASALSTIGKIHDDMGEKQQALESYGQALELVRALDEPRGEASILSNIGRVYASVGDPRKALVFYGEALPIRRRIGDRRGEAVTLSGIGKAHEELGDLATAADRYMEALALSRAAKDLRGQSSALARLGLIREREGDLDQALDLHRQSLEIRKTNGERFAEGVEHRRIGALLVKRGELPQARESFQAALALAQAVGDPAEIAESLTSLAELERRSGDFSAAREKLETALDRIEGVRTGIASPDVRAAFVALSHRTFELYVEVLMSLHRQRPAEGFDARALAAAERGRARALLDILGEAGVDLRQGADPALISQERSQRALLETKLERRMRLMNGKHTSEQLAEADAAVEKAAAEYDRLVGQLRSSSPAYAAVVKPVPVSLAEVQRDVVSEGSVFLEFSLGEERSFLWVVTPRSISSHELPRRASVEAAARNLQRLLTARSRHAAAADAAASEAATTLAAMILAPAAAELKEKKLLVVADGALHYVPFGVLPLRPGGEALVASHEIVMLPSASVAALLARQPRRAAPDDHTLALLADPVFDAEDSRVGRESSVAPRVAVNPPVDDRIRLRSPDDYVLPAGAGRLARLPFARREAEAILALVPKAKRMEALDFDASLATARNPDLSRYRFVHFATHGVLNDAHPELSGLVLSLVDRTGAPRPGFLSTASIFNLRLPADLVVLSGCETALGEDVKGEGLVGLTRAFLHAGARGIAASLWAVDDAATAQLMANFYRGMLGKRRLSPPAALREAQLEMRRTPRWSAPYFWAGFVLEGDWN